LANPVSDSRESAARDSFARCAIRGSRQGLGTGGFAPLIGV
jgi:hypothetical protein